jgi:hypothetical protein
MSVSYTGPVRIYKYNNPTNNGVIAPDNTGAARTTQQAVITPITATASAATNVPTFAVGQTTATPLVLPAGAIIENIRFYQTTTPSALTGGVYTVQLAVTNPTTGAVTNTTIGTITPSTTPGIDAISFAATDAATALLANIGTLDATIVFNQAAISAITGTLAGTFNVEYTPRNYTGSIINVGQGYTNQ